MNSHLDNPEGFRSLEFDLPSALLKQVIDLFSSMESAPLTENDVSAIPNGQGVYQLFHSGKLVYIGKTDRGAGLRSRLTRHSWYIKSRENLSVAQMTFKAIQVLVFSAMDLETALIDHYRKIQQAPAWNGSGFGNNDPGRKRDTTALKLDGFDANYPINIDHPLIIAWPDNTSAQEVLAKLASSVPYTVRHQKTPEAIADLGAPVPRLYNAKTTARDVVRMVVDSLPTGWQATRLSGRIILYRENVDDYPGSEIIARST